MNDKRGFRLRQYIEKKQQAAGAMNTADHRPTFRAEMDAIGAKADELYARGQEFMKTVTDGEGGQMRAYHEFARGRYAYTTADELVDVRIGEKWMLVPFFMADIETARKLRDILCARDVGAPHRETP